MELTVSYFEVFIAAGVWLNAILQTVWFYRTQLKNQHKD